jgi:hypothetical protein
MSGDLLDDQPRVAARVNLIEPEAARVLQTGQQRAVLRHAGARDPDHLAVRRENRAVRASEHVADCRRARIAT